jgi:hypothetical protein
VLVSAAIARMRHSGAHHDLPIAPAAAAAAAAASSGSSMYLSAERESRSASQDSSGSSAHHSLLGVTLVANAAAALMHGVHRPTARPPSGVSQAAYDPFGGRVSPAGRRGGTGGGGGSGPGVGF